MVCIFSFVWKMLRKITVIIFTFVLQRGNPLLRFIRNVPYIFSDIVPDYVMSPQNCAIFLR